MENNNRKPMASVAKDDLLEELESIKGLLDDSFDEDQDLDFDIPILDDVVKASGPLSDKEGKLLDLDNIFDDSVPEGQTIKGEMSESSISNLELSESDLRIKDTKEMPSIELDTLISDIETIQKKTSLTDEQDPLTLDQSTIDKLNNQSHQLFEDALADEALIDDDTLIDDDSSWLKDESVKQVTATAVNQLTSEEEQQELFEATQSEKNIDNDQHIDLDFLVQELVDEFIPQIEDHLRRRLSSCSAAVIKQLAKKHLD